MSARSYVVGLPVVVTVTDEEFVTVEVDLSELASEVGESDEGAADVEVLERWVSAHAVRNEDHAPASRAARVERAREEIRADVRSGTVPADVKSFSELHDYVDANGYGGLFEEEVSVEEANALQNDLDAWIRAGGIGVCRFCLEGDSEEAGQVVDGFHVGANCRHHFEHEEAGA